MALITCPECGGPVSSCATTCPHCGFPVAPQTQNMLEPTKIFRLCCVRINNMQIVQQHLGEIADLLDIDVNTLREEMTHRGGTLADHVSRARAEELQQILNGYSITTMVRNIALDSQPRAYSTAADTSPKCPHCGSTNISKISTTSRMISTGLFGLASSKIGKTMECKKCGYKW